MKNKYLWQDIHYYNGALLTVPCSTACPFHHESNVPMPRTGLAVSVHSVDLYHRDEHSRRLEELKRRQSNFTKCDDSTTIKESRDLRCRIEELEMKNDKLRSCLLEEIEKREKAEAKLSEIDSTRGRMSFFMVRDRTIQAVFW